MTPRWMKGLLVGSLTLNLLVAGLVVGAALSDGRGGHIRGGETSRGGAAVVPPELGLFVRNLERADRRKLRQRLRAEGGLREGLDAIRANRAEGLAALRAQPFDAAALTEAMSRHVALQGRVTELGATALASVIAEMSDAERMALADRLEAGHPRGSGRVDR